ncbi:(2,3-dihydroxybenzoyl)adenylate synthase [Geodermatophilus maliterrae]|uniref:(2,3-dihydroxybenzoyl)adenylate synthase n=1 Tax=Geodermatophilus maliterrae TaxID=3162531 RepID=A0ABV3XHT9_9ACTN
MKRADVVPWPAETAAAYRDTGCWRGRGMGSRLWEWADRWGERTAVVDGEHRLTYRELAERADGLADGLTRCGLEPGDVVLVQLPNCWEFVVVTLACLRAGVVPVMMLPTHRERELGSIGAHVQARALVVPDSWRGYDHQALAERLAATLPGRPRVLTVGDHVRAGNVDLRALMRPPADPSVTRARLDTREPQGSDPAVLLLSGGTTGLPKVVCRTHDDYDYNIRCVVRACGFGPDTVYLAVLPAGHNFALANPGILGTLYAGGTAVVLPSPRPEAVFAVVAAERVTATSAVPSVVLSWMEHVATHDVDVTSLRHVHVGGSVLAPEVAARIGPTLGCRLQQVYGMAEGLICYTPVDADEPLAHATQGLPVSPYDELLVVDAEGRPVPAGGVGELLTRGPYTPRGYVGVPGTNAQVFTSEGWFRTGDLVRLTPEGAVVVCGRVKDLVNRGGEKVSSAEVELLVQELPQVAEAAAVPMPDPVLGERVCLFVRLHAGRSLDLDRVRAALTRRGLAAFKLPERLVVVAALPHTAVGKPDKKRLAHLVAHLVAHRDREDVTDAPRAA